MQQSIFLEPTIPPLFRTFYDFLVEHGLEQKFCLPAIGDAFRPTGNYMRTVGKQLHEKEPKEEIPTVGMEKEKTPEAKVAPNCHQSQSLSFLII